MSADNVAAMLDHNELGDVNLRGAGAQDCRGMSVWVRLDRMQWGGEYLPMPCTFAHGLVIDCKDVNEGLDSDAPAVWVVDFGAHFGVQRIGELDCELIRPHRRRQGGDDEEGVVHAALEDWASLGEGAATNHVQYRWSRGRGRGRGGGRGTRGGAATRASGAAVRSAAAGRARTWVRQCMRGAASQRSCATIFDPLSDNSEAEDDWQPGDDARSGVDNGSMSSGDSNASEGEAIAQSLM
jgi:hypothetical protein